MQAQYKLRNTKGFTLIELLVAMAITSIIVLVLVSITSMALDTWNRSRSSVRAERQARALIDTMARDFEALVTRNGNSFQWLSAVTPAAIAVGGDIASTSAADLVFITAPTDRYNGAQTATQYGDVSCVGYKLFYRDPITVAGGTYQTFVLNRHLVNPDLTFTNLLGQTDLAAAFAANYSAPLNSQNSFLCENIYQFSVTFHIQFMRSTTSGTTTTTTPINIPITIKRVDTKNSATIFNVTGNGIVSTVDPDNSPGLNTASDEEIKSARLVSVEIAVTVISDSGIDQIRSRRFPTPAAQAKFIAKNSFEYSKVIPVPSM